MPDWSWKEIIRDFPELSELKKEVQAIQQLGARMILKELELRRKGGTTSAGTKTGQQFPREMELQERPC